MTIIRFKLRTLNRIAHVFCCAVVLEVDEAGDEPTRISIEWKGLPWSNLRKRWDAKWFPHPSGKLNAMASYE
jgi:hypothetical protein